MTGTIGILNVGAGDTKLTFDRNNPAERIRAARIVKDMLRRGYALLIEIDDGSRNKRHRRALDFDENTCEYIIADFDPIVAQQRDAMEVGGGTDIQIKPVATPAEEKGNETVASAGAEPEPRRRGGRGARIRVKADKARGVAVSRTAGG